MENMSDIVWAINPVNDSFAYIINRLEAFSRQLLEAKEIVFDFKVDDHARNIKLSMLQRRNFYFIAKEAVNNAAKYSEAKSCSISIELEGKNIVIVITDNGKGFDLEHQNHFGGNGMVNMSKRATEMKGKLKIKTGNGGTTITLSFPIHL
jgi:signal transduction histidine kinase